MSTQATGILQIEDWKETPFKTLTHGAKLTRATVTQTLSGDLKGDSTVEYLMAYSSAKSATFTGIQYVKGRVGGRSGSMVLQVTGTFENGVAKGRWSVIPDVGTGGLSSLRGKGTFKAPMGCEASYKFNYDLS